VLFFVIVKLSLSLWENERLKLFENEVMMKQFVLKRDDVARK
jgi:hypothetical protein